MPKDKVLKCNILRKKDGTHKINPKFYVYTNEGDRFIMAAKKMLKNLCTYYVITVHHDILEHDEFFLAILRSNFVGTKFNIYDNGKNPKHSTNKKDLRALMGTVSYVSLLSLHKESNFMGIGGARKMRVYFPSINQESNKFLKIIQDQVKI